MAVYDRARVVPDVVIAGSGIEVQLAVRAGLLATSAGAKSVTAVHEPDCCGVLAFRALLYVLTVEVLLRSSAEIMIEAGCVPSCLRCCLEERRPPRYALPGR